MPNGKNGSSGSKSNKNFWECCAPHLYNQTLTFVLLSVLALWVGAKFLNEVDMLRSPSLEAPTISVSGKGKVFALPDVGFVSLSIVREGSDPSKIQDESAETVGNIITFLKNSGVPENNIKTTSYNLSPVYSVPEKGGSREISGYSLRQTLEIKIGDFNKMGAIISGAGDLGANQIGSVRFEVDKPEKFLAQARVEAIRKAKEKAEDLADNLGVRLGGVVSYNEFGGPTPVFARGLVEDSSVASIPSGENEIAVNVNLSFEIE